MTVRTVESRYAWLRLYTSLLLSTIAGVGMWAVVVALPAVQADFGVARAAASFPYALTMLGFGAGSIITGRLSDRFGIMVPLFASSVSLATGFIAASFAPGIGAFALAQGALIGFGTAASFSPLLAHMSQWFDRRRGIAVAIVASGSYAAGALWPPVVQHFIETSGWRATYFGVGVFCAVTLIPLCLMFRTPAPPAGGVSVAGAARRRRVEPPLDVDGRTLQWLLVIAGICCCVAMSMPQVHLVAYCADLGYGPARGAQMLSVMLAFGVVSRIAFGVLSDRIGGLRTLLTGSVLQGVALLLFLPFDGLTSLYVVSALFGLFQGGIVPAYAIIIRDYFPAREAGTRVSLVITATLVGMALGGWMSGAIFDLTGSYRAAFVNGILFNLVNVSIVGWLLWRRSRQPPRRVRVASFAWRRTRGMARAWRRGRHASFTRRARALELRKARVQAGIAERPAGIAPLVALRAFQDEAAALGDAARPPVRGVGDDLDAHRADVLEGIVDQAGNRLGDEAFAHARGPAPVADLRLGRVPDRAMQARAADQLAARALEQEEGQVLARDEVGARVAAIGLGRFRRLLGRHPGQRGEELAQRRQRLLQRLVQHGTVAGARRPQQQALGADLHRQVEQDRVDHPLALASKAASTGTCSPVAR